MKKIVILIISLIANNSIQAQTLLAQYNFDGNALDVIGNHHGTLINGPTYTMDRFGNPTGAIQLDGINDYVEFANGLTLQSNTYTYDVWVKSTANPTTGTAQCVLSVGGTGGDQLLTNQNAGATGWNFSGYQNPNGTFNLYASVTPVLNQWYHITGIRDLTVSKIYLDGVLVDSAVLGAATTPKYGQNFAYLGKRTNVGAVGPQYFHGAVDDLKIYAGNNMPLPLDLISFAATQKNTTAQLTWQTANMINVKGFEVEKSKDAKNYQTIGFVYASEVKNYSFDDKDCYERSNYYRLKMIDIDGQYRYSKTIMLINNTKMDATLYPNPVKNEMNIVSSSSYFTYTIIDMYGKEVLNGESNSAVAIVPCSSFPKGMYFVQIQTEDETKTMKFIKE